MGGNVCLRCKGKTFCFQKFVDFTQQCFALLHQINFLANNQGYILESFLLYQISLTWSKMYHCIFNIEMKHCGVGNINFFNSRLKAIKKQMGHAVAETDAEEEALKAQYKY